MVVLISSYRKLYKTPLSLESTKNTLKGELLTLQRDLQELQNRSPSRRQNNYFDLDNFLTNKFLLIGGCILLGIGIAYFLFNPNSTKRRC